MQGYLPIYAEGLRYELIINGDGAFTLSDENNASLYLAHLSKPLTVACQKGALLYYFSGEEAKPLTGAVSLAEGIHIANFQETQATIVDLQGKQRVGINQNDIVFKDVDCHLLLTRMAASSWQLTIFSGEIYLNNKKVSQHKLDLVAGDEICFADKKIRVYVDELHLWGETAVSGHLAKRASSRYSYYEGYPDYHRSPRLIYRGSEEKMEVKAPPKEPRKPTDQILKLVIPPLMMIGITVLITLVQPRGIYILMTVGMSTVTLIFSVSNYFKNRKQYKEDIKERIDTYNDYLAAKSIELREKANTYRKGLLYHYPDIKELDRLAQRYHHRIYEKTAMHFDFLHYRLGLGRIKPSYPITYSEKERYQKTDELEKEGFKLYEANRKVSDVPIAANLVNGPVGYIGERQLVIEQLQLMVSQLAFFHSYHEIQFIPIFPEEERDQWEWMRWFPHVAIQDMNVRGFVYNQRSRDQVLNSLNQILKLRQAEKNQQGRQETVLFSPHYVVLITDEKLVIDHPIMEFFNEEPTQLGCSIILVQDALSSLSENVKTIVNIKDVNYGELVMEEGKLKNLNIALDHFPKAFNKENFSRRLAPLNHIQNLKASIPETVTFLELYQAETFEDLKIRERWKENNPYKSLAVPLGLRGQDDVVYLNLHEKAHGPHGLVAGTTGSGKSELIQSYILSLAVNFHPYDVAFLLIDYKGGGMANLFKNLPHLLGTITNLDGAQSMRALASINAELKRRQRLFAEAEVNHINQYQKKYQLGEVNDPMPHLFLISDEFAELKADQPDFMTELVSTARIGRSLGIHLILATQKPSGVVNDQIWSNSRFKIALKVAERADSQEMLRTADAANIKQAGRAYLQVGNNEVYELFQSAWSGAEYQPEKEEQGIEDHVIYVINDLGQYTILNQDLSGLGELNEIKEVPTELEAIIQGIRSLAQAMQIKMLPQPWLPPLEERISVETLRTVKPRWTAVKPALEVVYGMADVPSQQSQFPVRHSFSEQGHLIVFSAPGMGKSTFLQTVAMELARFHTPEQLHIYLLDFGTNGLLPLYELPHVADMIRSEESEKVRKFVRRIYEEIRNRKQKFAKQTVANIEMYERFSQERLPNILLLTDGFDGLKETAHETALETLVNDVAREGASLGIYIVMTAGRPNNVRAQLQANIKTKISLKLNEDSDIRSVVGGGREKLMIEGIPGRGMTVIDGPESFQTALPTVGADDFEINEQIRNEAKQMSDSWTGGRPLRIPMVPESISFDEFRNLPSVQADIQEDKLPIGLDLEKVESFGLSLKTIKHMIILSDRRDHLVTASKHLIKALAAVVDRHQLVLINTSEEYGDFKTIAETYVEEDGLEQVIEYIKQVIQQRTNSPSDRENKYIIFTDVEEFVNTSRISENEFIMMYEKGTKLGLRFIVPSSRVYLGSAKGQIPKYIKNHAETGLVAMKMSDQAIFDNLLPVREILLGVDEIHLRHKDIQKKLKITKP